MITLLGCSVAAESSSGIRCFERERQALLKFKDGLVDDYGRLVSWDAADNFSDCCKWSGVRCHNRTNFVTTLDLHAPVEDGNVISITPLRGIVSSSLLELQHLAYLDLSANDFSNTHIPEFIGSLYNLQHLNLSHAFLDGPIPPHVGNLSKLLTLDFSSNRIYSSNLDWVSVLHFLQYLDLGYANLSKAHNLVQAISKLASIRDLHLSGCQFPPFISLPSVNISLPLLVLDLSLTYLPPSMVDLFLNLSSSIISIDLSGNNIHGPISDAFKSIITLENLNLSDNELIGGIPGYFGDMSSLRYISLSSNHLTGMNLSGPIEKKLEYLDLSYNEISGLLPNMSRFSFLKELYLGYNNLSGYIPQSCLPLPQLVVLNLMSNQFTGPIPDFSANSMLKLLYLSNNMFSGTLPVAVGGLSELEALNIRSNQLEGIITEVHLMNLSRLQYLDLSLNLLLTLNFTRHWVPLFQLNYMDVSHCKLVSPVPRFLRTQKQLLYLDISHSQVSSSVSSLFRSLSPMPVYLNASNNQIYGPFPNSSTSRLSDHLDLDLSRNKISGSVDFLCYYTNVSFVDLSDNLLSDKLPDCFEHFKILEFLNLANNNFSSRIPNSFGFLESLIWLHLGNNSFTEGIPESMRNCRALSIMDLQGNALMGEIPAWLGDSLSRLVVLILRSNAFYGNIPSNICSLHQIQVLDLSSNNISGGIPKCLHNLTDLAAEIGRKGYYVFEYQNTFRGKDDSATLIWKGQESKYRNTLYLVKLIDLSSNNLVGEIPPEITTLTGLVGLNLSRNNLIGPIPQNIGMLTSLNFLDFSRNHLSGGIPTSLSELSSLGILDLSSNNLSGRIPQNDHSLTIDESAYIGNVGLCGPPLNKSCQLIPSFTGETNLKHEDENDDFITDGFYISMGIGFVVGLWGIIGTLFIKKSFRNAFLGW